MAEPLPRLTDSQFLGKVRDDLLDLQRRLEERNDPARWPDLEAAIRLAEREAEREHKGLAAAAIFRGSA